ncbi:sulfur carrier protein ThiS [Parvularcula oceani]|uniref:sulfur carrier protein ThiS n=1 Tax=Parvularcula oceani TaxID=1247963 RepID=UPI0004E1FDC6|nr:sulfur carrier protein ThiS [Parvularcula oceani]
MNIIVNGESRRIATEATVAGLLEEFGLPPRKIAIERNREIVPKSAYGTTALRDGDEIEIVQFVGGG